MHSQLQTPINVKEPVSDDMYIREDETIIDYVRQRLNELEAENPTHIELFRELCEMEIQLYRTKSKGKKLRREIRTRLMTIHKAMLPLQGLGSIDLECQMWDALNPLARLQEVCIDSVSTLKPKVSTVVNTAHEVLQQMKELLSRAQNIVSSDAWTVIKDIVIALIFCLINRSVSPLVQAGMTIASTRYAAYVLELIQNVQPSAISLDSFSPLPMCETGYAGLQCQDSLDIVSISKTVCAAVATIAAIIYEMPVINFKQVLEKMSLVGRAAQGFTNFNQLFSKSVELVEDTFGKWKHGSNYESVKMNKQYPYLETCMDVLVHFKSNGKARETLGANRSACKVLRWCYQHMCACLDGAIARRQTELSIRLRELKKDLSSLNILAESLLYSNCRSRVAPVVVFLHGKAGTGKTQVLEMLCKDLAKDMYEGIPTDVLKYARKAETEYWDGYRPEHKIVTYDDIFQINDSTAKPNPEVMEIIRVANSESYQLHMSAIEDKSNTFFNSDFVFATSNASTFTPRSIACPDALNRRFDLKVETKTRPEFGRQADAGDHLVPDPRLVWKKQNPDSTDAEMVAQMMSGEFEVKNDKCVYDFTVAYSYYGESRTEDMTYDQLYEVITRKRAEKVKSFKVEDTQTLQVEMDEGLKLLHKKLCIERGLSENDEFLECQDSGTVRDVMKRFIGSFPSVEQVRNYLEPSWAKFTKVVSILGAISTMISLANFGWQYFTRCPLKSNVEKGVSINTLLETKLCGCKLCKDVKTHNIVFRPESRYLPRHVVKQALALLANCCMANGVAMSGAYHFIDIPVLVHNQVGQDFSFFSGHRLKAWTRKSSLREVQDEIEFWSLDNDLEQIEAESYQDIKPRLTLVESHQNPEVKRNYVEDCESYQDAHLRQKFVESHQDPKVKLQLVESYQDQSVRRPVVESYQDVKPKTHLVECKEENLDKMIDNMLTQASGDENTTNVVRKLFCRNLVVIRNPDNACRVHGLFVRGTWLVTNAHFIKYLQNDILEYKEFATDSFKQAKVLEKHVVSRGGLDIDLVIVKLDNGVGARPDITGNFPLAGELSHLSSATDNGKTRIVKSMQFAMRAHGKEVLVPCLETLQDVSFIDQTQARHSSGEIFHIRKGIYASANTERGDCGAPYVVFNPAARPKILGIHAAGQEGVACGVVVTQEDLTHLVSQDVCPDYTGLEQKFESPLPNTLCLGTVEGVSCPRKSNIVPSGLHGTFPLTKGIACMYDYNEDLMLKNTLKVTKETTLLDEDLLDVCQHDIQKLLTPNSKDIRRLLTHEESIRGIEGRAYINSVNAHTSAGWPYVLKREGMPGKSKWLGQNGEFRTDDLEVIQHVERIEEYAKKGVFRPIDGIFLASLKDERRPLEKVKEKKTRVFAASNLGLSLVVRKYFMGFMEHIMNNRIDNEIGLGMNAYSMDWKRLVDKLQSKGDNIIAGDFSNFDGSLNSQILARICDVVTAWYGDASENGLTRKAIYNYIFRSAWLLRDTVVQLNHSQPSGNPLTTMINCLYNMFIFRYVYLLAQKKAGLVQNLVAYRRHVAGVYYGDDSILSVRSDVLPWFNQLTITSLMAETGHTYTDESKSTSLLQSKPLSQCTFLKRGFVSQDGTWAAPLAVETLHDMVMWRKKGNSDKEAVLETTRFGSFEAFLHGRQFFDEYTNTLMRACSERNLPYGGLSFLEARNFWLSQQNSSLMEEDLLSLLFSV